MSSTPLKSVILVKNLLMNKKTIQEAVNTLKNIERSIWLTIEKTNIIFILLFMGLIYFLSTIPGMENEESLSNTLYLWVETDIQKFGHVAIYALLAIFWFIYLSKKKLKISLNISLILLTTVLFGVLCEWAQLFIPGRYASLSDIMLNTIGVILGLIYCSCRYKAISI